MERKIFEVTPEHQVQSRMINIKYPKGVQGYRQQRDAMAKELQETYQTQTGHVLGEVSTSGQTWAKGASAYNLKLKTTQGVYTVEHLFHAAKVFNHQDHPLDRDLNLNAQDAHKQASAHSKSGEKITSFELMGQKFPNQPDTFFYNWLYCNALMQHQDLSNSIRNTQAFSDIHFKQGYSKNCQAEACAIVKALSDRGQLNTAMQSADNFYQAVYQSDLLRDPKYQSQKPTEFQNHTQSQASPQNKQSNAAIDPNKKDPNFVPPKSITVDDLPDF